jgi:hypothetical protein
MRPAVLMAIALDRLTNRRVMDNGQQLGQMIRQEPVREHLVAVMQLFQMDIPSQVIRLMPQLCKGSANLLVQGQYRRKATDLPIPSAFGQPT